MGKWMKNMKKILFYSAAGLCGIVVVPTLGLIAAVFTLCGVVCPIAGVVKLAGHLLHFDVPFVMFEWGGMALHPAAGCILSVIVGGLLYCGGLKCWRLLRFFIRRAGEKRPVSAPPRQAQ